MITCKVKVHVQSNEEALECELCHYWHHISCEKIPKTTYNHMKKKDGVGLHWFCKRCNKGAMEMINVFNGLKERQDALEQDMEVVKGNVQKHDDILMY